MMFTAGSVNIVLSSRHRTRRTQKFMNNRELKTVHRTWDFFKLLRSLTVVRRSYSQACAVVPSDAVLNPKLMRTVRIMIIIKLFSCILF